MNLAEFKDPVPNMCLAGSVVASWSLTQELAGWQFQALLLSLNSVKHLRKTPLGLS